MKKNKDTENISPEDSLAETEGVAVTQKTVNKVGSLLKEMRLQKGLRIPDVSKNEKVKKVPFAKINFIKNQRFFSAVSIIIIIIGIDFTDVNKKG